MKLTRILVADDDEMIVDALKYQLEREGYEVSVALDGEQALEMGRTQPFDLILLDVMMPKLHGWEVCRELRHTSTVPILMLTARGEEIDRVLGLELGADDYMVKPVGFRELLARVRAQLRRAAYVQNDATSIPENELLNSENVYWLGPTVIDLQRHTVQRNGQSIHLTFREFELLRALILSDGIALKRGDLLDQAWGEAWIGDPRTLDVHIHLLREKLEDDPSNPQFILTLRNVGYRLATLRKFKK